MTVPRSTLAPPEGAPARLNRRWEVIILGALINMCLGTVYSWSVFRAPLEAALAIAPARSGIPYSVFLATFAFSMPVAGAVVARFGARRILLAGGTLVGVGWTLGGLAEGLGALSLGYGLIGGFGVGLGYTVTLTVAAAWFPGRRGLAMGLVLAGFGMSPFATAPIAEALIGIAGVRRAMLVLGVSYVGVVVALARWMRLPAVGPAARQAPDAKRDESGLSPREMVATGRFRVLWICYVIGTLAGLTAIGKTGAFAIDPVGLTPAAAARTVALFGVLNGAGRPLFGMLHDRLGTRTTVIIAFSAIALAAVAGTGAAGGSVVLFYPAFGLLWLLLGGWLAIAPAATARLFGFRHYARNYGIMYTAYGVGALAGGTLSAVALARFGSHVPFFGTLVALALVGIVVAWVGLGERGRPMTESR